jgi:hypothetical protein
MSGKQKQQKRTEQDNEQNKGRAATEQQQLPRGTMDLGGKHNEPTLWRKRTDATRHKFKFVLGAKFSNGKNSNFLHARIR